MGFFDRTGKRTNGTPTDDGSEAVLAQHFLEEARAGSLTAAVEKLGEYQKLVKNSPNRRNYDPDAVQNILGEHVANYISQVSPDSFQPKFPADMGIGPVTTKPLETVIDDTIFVIGEIANGLMDEGKTKTRALERCRTILSQRYQQILQDVAATALTKEQDNSYPFEKLVNIYEQLCSNYQKDVGSVAIPTIKFRERGEVVERNTTRVVYRGAINHFLTSLESVLSQDDQDVASDYVANLIETAPAKIDSYTQSAELSIEDKTHLENNWERLNKKREGVVARVSKSICDMQDKLYAAVETQAATGNYDAAVSAVEELANYTALYTRILEETAEEVTTKARNNILKEYFELE